MIALDDVPVRLSGDVVEEESGIVLLVPRYPTIAGRFMGKVLGRSKHIRVKLDDLGSAAWRLIDDRRSVRGIGERLKAEIGEKAEPLYERLGEFLDILTRNKMIRLVGPGEVDHVEQGRA
ncbi:MAG: PqqD family protein [Planctomycetota bacterium]